MVAASSESLVPTGWLLSIQQASLSHCSVLLLSAMLLPPFAHQFRKPVSSRPSFLPGGLTFSNLRPYGLGDGCQHPCRVLRILARRAGLSFDFCYGFEHNDTCTQLPVVGSFYWLLLRQGPFFLSAPFVIPPAYST